jgi:hypothetical protein
MYVESALTLFLSFSPFCHDQENCHCGQSQESRVWLFGKAQKIMNSDWLDFFI